MKKYDEETLSSKILKMTLNNDLARGRDLDRRPNLTGSYLRKGPH